MNVSSARLGRWHGSVAGRAASFVALVLVVLFGWAAPASAHGLSGPQPTNYVTRITALTPHVAAVSVRVIDLGNRIELRNASRHVVTVLGYQGEPYLRLGPQGVWRNQRSPATFLNRTTLLTAPAPPSYSASAPPDWRQISSGTVVRWHDHRTHWMAPSAPAVVQHDPGRRHVVLRWSLALRIDARPAILTGEVVWVPGPAPWPWAGLALLVAVSVALVTRIRPTWCWVLAVLVAGETAAVAHGVAAWDFSTASLPSRIGLVAYDAAALATGLLAGWATVRHRSLYRVSPPLLLAGVVLAIGVGGANVMSLFRSQLPSVFSAGAVRALVAAAIGIGVGLLVTGATHLRSQGPAPPIRAERAAAAGRVSAS